MTSTSVPKTNSKGGFRSGASLGLRYDTPVQFIKGVGPKLGDRFKDHGVFTVQDLLEWYPRAYEDRRAARSIASLKPDELVSLRAEVVAVKSYNLGRSRRKVYDLVVRDETGKIHCKFFRVPYKGYFERFQPGSRVRVIGKVTFYRGQIEFHHPDVQDDAPDTVHDDDIVVPIYPETEGVTNRQLRKLIGYVLDELAKNLDARKPEQLPRWLLDSLKLPSRFEALGKVHRPPKDATTDFAALKSPYHHRLIFDEFFWLELWLASRKQGVAAEPGLAMDLKLESVEKLRASLPFALTGAQMRTFQEIANDLTNHRPPRPMHRLVQGDVGSGKTMVALLSGLLAIENGYQVALMVPTEILAEQHYKTARRLLEPLGITVGLFTGSIKASERAQAQQLLASGAVQLAVGTHALIEDAVGFKNLGLVVIDEQHRFGVHQRAKLKAKGKDGEYAPHFLIMTATPIPRTLAMTVYGDLDVSIIDELPKGRSPIQTRVGYESHRPKMIEFVRAQIAKGRQAYFVYPLVEESEKIDLKNAMTEFENLKEKFPEAKLGLLHGRMKPDEKEDVMRRFRDGEYQILVATTVIEVGVDVPNANVMVIEHSERFGLSQLHQLRGRVGRGEHKSYCMLMLGHAVSEEARERVNVMEETTDGFVISERDLEIRGPGEFLGTRQSGLPGFKLANIVRDARILQEARDMAFEIFSRDPRLSAIEHRPLREELLRAHGATSLASIG
ncbi:MAG: ATP-dependent DNA helicase RecG [Bdellovibrionales bacterium]|nr:ATP-dependent DNA helicase RecG [Bdellovibrionales bacterium]